MGSRSSGLWSEYFDRVSGGRLINDVAQSQDEPTAWEWCKVGDGKPKTFRPRFQFNLLGLLLVFTLFAVAFGLYKPISRHLQAIHYLGIPKTGRAIDPKPTEFFYDIEGHPDAILCHVEQVRIVLLGRMRSGGIMGLIPVAGVRAKRGGDRSTDGELVFSYAYAEGEARCEVYGLEFLCRSGQVEIDGQAFDADTPAVILVDRDNRVFHTYTP